MTTLRVVVIDDEPLAREGLAEMLARFPEVAVVGAYGDAVAALRGLDAVRPDAIFVDIRMPGSSGIELVESLDLEPLPAVVFVTAHHDYAVRAFELHALDYLLKPVTAERLGETIERLRHTAGGAGTADLRRRLTAMLETLEPGGRRGVGRLIVREVGQIVVVATRDLDWIEGADYYAKLHTGAKVHLLRESLTALERRLDPHRFMRVHRSAIVNLGRVRSVESQERGAGVVVLATGARLRITSDRREELERRLEAFHDE